MSYEIQTVRSSCPKIRFDIGFFKLQWTQRTRNGCRMIFTAGVTEGREGIIGRGKDPKGIKP